MCSRSVSNGNLLLIDCWNCLCHFFKAHCIILCVDSSPQSPNDAHMTNHWDQGGMWYWSCPLLHCVVVKLSYQYVYRVGDFYRVAIGAYIWPHLVFLKEGETHKTNSGQVTLWISAKQCETPSKLTIINSEEIWMIIKTNAELKYVYKK